MATQKKNYLITYTDGSLGVESVSSVLHLSKRKYLAGVASLSGDKKPADDEVLHFENLGVSSAMLSADEVKALNKNANILAVEEDYEMKILEVEGYSPDQNSAAQNAFLASADAPGNNYQKGVSDAVKFIFKALTSDGSAENSSSSIPPIISPLPLLPGHPPVAIPLVQAIPWNINMVKAPLAWARGYNGSGINVAVLDTGIAAHPDLVVSGGVSFVPGVVSYNDGNSHGTHCAGIIGARNNAFGVVGVAPNCNLYAVKVLADSGSGNSSWIIAGMDWCITHGIKVISMSLGGDNAPSVAYAQAVKRCQDAGITVCVASGNHFGTAFPWVASPANSIISGTPNASPIAVGAVDNGGVIAPFSSRGGQTAVWNQVNVVAPGVSINSTIPGGSYGIKSGTSMATPHVAGAAALVKQRFPAFTPAQVKGKLRSTAVDLGPLGVDVAYGSGLINCNLATT